MHRWFFADEEIICKEPTPPPTPPSPIRTSSPTFLPDTLWKFTVKFKGKLCSNESVAICGSLEVLGKWHVQQCLLLHKEEDSSLWTTTVALARKCEVRYRYLICATNGCGRRIVRFWETHKGARLVRPNDEQDEESKSHDIFGTKKGRDKLDRGWLTIDAKVVQFKFYRAPFILKSQHFKNPLLYVKVTAMKVKPRKKCEKDKDPKLKYTPSMESQLEDDSTDQDLRATFAFCEVASLREQGGAFHFQPKYGTSCGPDGILIFHLTVGDVENTAYLIDLYNYPPKAAADIPPYHFGYQYVLPPQLKGSEGTLKLNIMCATKHRSIGSMQLDYLVVNPLHSHDFTLKDTFQRHWKKKQEAIDIGHRGCGKSFWLQDNILRENTLNSFNEALEHGADMVEFDVLLTRDKIPIVYHDLQFYISRKINLSPEEYDIMTFSLDSNEIDNLKPFARVLNSGLISLPVSKFTLEQLRRVQVYEMPEDCPRTPAPCTVDTKLNLPFPTLEHVLKKISTKLGFNIEVKWSQRSTDGCWEEFYAPDMDKNEYVDTILDVVLKKGGLRRIVFSSFDADVCTMIRLKQNRYPVMFLCKGTAYEPKYLDPRGDSLLSSCYFAHAMELLGVVIDAGDILEFPGQITNMRERNIRIYAWGADNRLEKFRNSLNGVGVDGIIFDRINHVLDVGDLKHNVVLIELREKTREMSLQDEALCKTNISKCLK